MLFFSINPIFYSYRLLSPVPVSVKHLFRVWQTHQITYLRKLALWPLLSQRYNSNAATKKGNKYVKITGSLGCLNTVYPLPNLSLSS